MKYILTLALLITGLFTFGQGKVYLRGDTIIIEKSGGSAELQIKSATRAIGGILANIGNGITRFYKSRLSNDTLFIGLDTLTGVGSGSGTNNTNTGTGFRLLIPGTQAVKTVFGNNTIAIDSASNANALTFKADTSVLATQYDLTQISTGALTKSSREDSVRLGTSAVYDRDNPFNNYIYRGYNLRNFETIFYRMTQGYGNNLCIVLLGDSQVENPWNLELNYKKQLSDKWPVSGPGVLTGMYLLSNLTAHNWTLKTLASAGTGLKGYSVVSTGSSTDFSFTGNGAGAGLFELYNQLQLMYMGKAGGGTFSILVDGVPLDTINTSLLTGAQLKTYSTLSKHAYNNLT